MIQLYLSIYSFVFLQAILPSQGPPLNPVYDNETDEEPDVEDIDVNSKVAIDQLLKTKHTFLYLKGQPFQLCK